MSVETTAALLALALSLIARRRRRRGQLGLDDLAIALALHAGLVGVVATLLAWAGWFGVHALSLTCVALALLCWPWTLEREHAPAGEGPLTLERATGRGPTLVLLAVVAAGVGLRTPPISAPLAGRDQGTYVLRAQQSLRTGALGWTDPVLAAAGRELESGLAAPGTFDILGLYPVSDEPWRRGHYEGAYRPGAYLGDREAGEVIPQFFHLHPMLLAVAGVALPVARPELMVTWIAGLWLLCLACCGRRLWPRTWWWAALAVSLVAASPLAIWTGRTPLSESPMALFEWAAVLVALRMRDGVEGEREGAWIIAACLGFCAGVRGNALLILPIVLAISWLRPRADRAVYLVLGSLLASVILHAMSSYPYVHDELLRRIPELELGPLALVGVAVLAAIGWMVIDLVIGLVPAGKQVAPKLVAIAPRMLALAGFAAALMWWSLRSEAPPGPPYSRLDAAPILLGLPLLGAAGAGTILVARRWRPTPDQIWLVALAAVVPATMLLYAPRQLPTLAFFYYGRYLVPELLPAAALAATAALELGARRLAGGTGSSRARRRVATGLGIAAGLGLLWSVAGPLIRHPQLRLREYAPADLAIEWLAARLPADAIVIAGGEGWHSGHTHNQVGGALAMTHGLEVLPYRTREDAWITAWELLVAGPTRRGEAPPPVYLLVNEAARHYTRADGARVALLDEQLWAPFVVERAGLLELFVHALTPLPDQLPTRVARHELRMALLRLRVDPGALERIEQLDFGTLDAPRSPPGVAIRGGLHDDGRTCVSPERPLQLTIPRAEQATHMVVITEVAGVKMSRRIPAWSLSIDGAPIELEPPKGLRPHPRATLGPVPLPLGDDSPEQLLQVEIRGAQLSEDARGPEACPHGRVAGLLLLPRERSSVFELGPDRVELATIAPAETLGHAIEPTIWVAGRSLSRYRPGTTPPPQTAGFALVLPAGASMSFAPVDLPLDERGRSHALDVVVTLAKTHTEGESQLHIYAGEQHIGTVHPPPMRKRSWVSEPFVWQPLDDRAELRVELDSPGGGEVELRDVALFARHAGLGPGPIICRGCQMAK